MNDSYCQKNDEDAVQRNSKTNRPIMTLTVATTAKSAWSSRTSSPSSSPEAQVGVGEVVAPRLLTAKLVKGVTVRPGVRR